MYEAVLNALQDPEIRKAIIGLKPHGYSWNDIFDLYYPPNGVITPASIEKAESFFKAF